MNSIMCIAPTKEIRDLVKELNDKYFKGKNSKEEIPIEPNKVEFNKLPYYIGNTKTYAGVGSRETPKEVLEQMQEVAKELEKLGYTLNTGDASGADKAFRESVSKNNRNVFTVNDATDRTRQIAKEIHPDPENLSSYALNLQARNTNQVFGKNLDTPVDFVLYYAKPSDNKIRPQGGTGQAVEMANRKGIPTINLYESNWREQLEEAINKGNSSNNQSTKEKLEKRKKIIEKNIIPFIGLNTKTSYPMIFMDGRYFVTINVKGIQIPFYMSSGLGGKKNVKTGKWYPFFGIGSDGWLNKTTEVDINNYYGIPMLKEIAETLDYMYPSSEYSLEKTNGIPVASGSKGEKVQLGNFTNFKEVFNKDFTPTSNTTGASKKVRENIKKVAHILETSSKDNSSTSDINDVNLLNTEITNKDVLDLIREFCAKKEIEQEDWEMYKEEALDYVRKIYEGEEVEVLPMEDGYDKAKYTIKKIVRGFSRIVKEGDNFEENHEYIVIKNGKETKADISVSSYNNIKDKKSFKINDYEKDGAINNVGIVLGNTFDSIVRNFFGSGVKKSYPNLDNKRLKAIVSSLELFKAELDRTLGKGKWCVMSEPFPIAGNMIDAEGNTFTIAGEVDLLIADSEGNIYIYDMKAIRDTRDITEVKSIYAGSLKLYEKIINSQFPNKCKKTGLIVARTIYPTGNISDNGLYTEKDGQLYCVENKKKVKIQALAVDDYNITLSFSESTSKNTFITEVYTRESFVVDALTEEFKTLEQEEKEELNNAPGIGGILNNESSLADAISLVFSTNEETDEITDVDVNLRECPLTTGEISYYGNKLAKIITTTVRRLQSNADLGTLIFPNKEKGYFLGMSVKDIFDEGGLLNIVEAINEEYFSLDNLEGIDFYKMLWIKDHFNTDILTAASPLISDLLGISIDNTNAYNEEEDSAKLENEDERESWQVDSREIDVHKSMSSILKSLFSTIIKYSYNFEENNDNIEDSIGGEWVATDVEFDDLNVVEFLDKDEVVNTLYTLLHTAKTLEEMKSRLNDVDNVYSYPWLPSISEFLNTNPELNSLFYTTMRKNKLVFNSITIEKKIKYIEDAKEVTTSVRIYDLAKEARKRELKTFIYSNIMNGNSTLFKLTDNNSYGLTIVDKEGAKELLELLNSTNNKRRRDYYNAIKNALIELGFEDYGNDLRRYRKNQLEPLYKAIKATLKVLSETAKGKTYHPIDDINLGKGASEYSAINNIITKLVNYLEPKESVSVYDNGKNYSSYVSPSFLGDLIENLSEYPIEEIRTFIESRYNTRQCCYTDKNGDLHFYSSFLETLYYGDNVTASNLKHIMLTSANNTVYSEMTAFDYPLYDILMFFSPHYEPSGNKRLAKYHIPIQSDKNAPDYLQFYKVPFTGKISDEKGQSVKEAKEEIAKQAIPMILFEMKRIKDIFRWSLNPNNPKIETLCSDIPEEIIRKLKNNENITDSDIIEKGKLKPFMMKGGAGFRLFNFMNAALVENSNFRKSFLNYLNNNKEDVSNIHKSLKNIFINKMDKGFEDFKLYIRTNDKIKNFINPASLGFDSIEEALEEYYWNSRLGSANILLMTIIDPAFYKNATDLQKRFAQVHSMTSRPDVSATFIDDRGVERKFSDGQHRYIILEDVAMVSKYVPHIEKMYDYYIEHEPDVNKKEFLKQQKKLTVKAYSNIEVTDGQAITSIHGYFKKMGMLGELTPAMKEAYYNIINNEDFNVEDYEVIFQPIKPFVFSWEKINVNGNSYYNTVQLKDSEYALMMTQSLINNYVNRLNIMEKDSPLIEFYNIMNDTAYDEDGNWTGTGIDTIVFHSVAKIGAHNIVNLQDIKGNIADYINKHPNVVHSHDFYDWGKQQETPAHLQDHEQGMPSQTRAIVAHNINPEEDIIVGKDNTGRTITKKGKKVVQEYIDAINEDFQEGVSNVENLFKLNSSKKRSKDAISTYLRESLLKDSRTTVEQIKAVSLRSGDYNVPIGDPVNMERFASNLFSAIKKRVNKEDIPGGPVVQVCAFGYKSPTIKFRKDGTLERMGVYLTCPSAELEDKLRLDNGLLMSPKEALKRSIITEDDLIGITSRIPVEFKYSINAIYIEAFLPRILGEMIIYPFEITSKDDSDFDVDKGYVELKYTEAKGDNPEGNVTKERKNRIIDLQYQLLTSKSSFKEMFSVQNKNPLKETALTINPNFEDNNLDMTMPEAQFYYQDGNMSGKAMVAVSASTNISHVLGSLTNIRIRLPYFTVNGKHVNNDGFYFKVDDVYSVVDGSNIAQTTGALTGVSADNAKSAIPANIMYNKAVSNYYTGLIRLGVPVDIVAYLFSQPAVIDLIKISNNSGFTFTDNIKKVANVIKETNHIYNIYDYLTDNKFDLNKEELIKNKSTHNEDYQNNIILLLSALSTPMDIIFKISNILKLNSTQNAVGPTIWKTLKNYYSIIEFVDDIHNKSSEINLFTDENIWDNIKTDLPFITTLLKVYGETVPKLMSDDFIPFSSAFIGLIDTMKENFGLKISEMSEKSLKTLCNEFMVYLATKKKNKSSAIDGSYNSRKRMFYDFPIEVLLKKKSDNNLLLNSIAFKSKATSKNKIPALTLSTANLNETYRDNLTSSWNSLLLKDELLNTKLSDDLIAYNIFRSGFFFSPNGFLNLASNRAKMKYNNNSYFNAIQASNWGKALSYSDYANFIRQYIRNHPHSSLIMEIPPTSKRAFEVVSKEEVRSKYVTTGAIRYGKELYLIRAVEEDGYAYYKKVTPLGFGKQGMEYNAEEDAFKMQSVNNNSYYAEVTKALGKIKKEEEKYYSEENNDYEDLYEEEQPQTQEDVILIKKNNGEKIDSTTSYVKFLENEKVQNIVDAIFAKDLSLEKEFYSSDDSTSRKALEQILKQALKEKELKEIAKEIKEKLDKICM